MNGVRHRRLHTGDLDRAAAVETNDVIFIHVFAFQKRRKIELTCHLRVFSAQRADIVDVIEVAVCEKYRGEIFFRARFPFFWARWICVYPSVDQNVFVLRRCDVPSRMTEPGDRRLFAKNIF
jgi:hypothetical protein